METIKNHLNICNVCGANLVPKDGHWYCPACGYYKAEETTSELDTLIYGAEQELRKANFDTAEEDYSDIVEKFPESAAGYWGRMKARYGIKYEKDEQDKYLPTCFADVDSVLNDRDYLSALQHADTRNAAVYKKEVQKIENIRKIWIEKAAKEKPYDVFICFKDTDSENHHTEDSRNARDLYGYLTEQGYRVFFSPISLMGKAGEEYEPYIYNALNTAAVMIVYGSKAEYFESVWMKNEWSRFLKRIKEKKKYNGSLLVVCNGVNPNELPIALRKIQALDTQSFSFSPTLLARVKTIVDKTKKPENVLERVQLKTEVGKKAQSVGNHISTISIIGTNGGATLKKTTGAAESYAVTTREIGQYSIPSLSVDETRKIAIVKTYLAEKMYDSALNYVESILSEHEASGEAALLKFLIQSKVENLAELKNTKEELTDFALIHKVIECNEKSVGEKFIAAICEYISVRLSKKAEYRREYPLTKEIAAYASDSVYNFLKNIDYTAALKADADVAEKYYRMFLSRQKSNDTDLFIALHHTFVTDCLNAGAIETARTFNNEILSWDESDYRANIIAVSLKVAYTAVNTNISDDDTGAETLFLNNSLYVNDDFNALKNIVAKLSQTDVEKFFSLLSVFLRKNTPKGNIEDLKQWYMFVLQYGFASRETAIAGLFEAVNNKNSSERAVLFDTLEKFLPPENVDEHIARRFDFAKSAQEKGEFSLAVTYYEKVLEIDEGNVSARWNILCCKANAADEKTLSDSLHSLSDFSCIRDLLKYCNEKKRAHYLNILMKSVFGEIEKDISAETSEKCADVFDELLKYIPENQTADVEKLIRVADACKKNGAFERGLKYYGLVLALNNKSSCAYWGSLQCTLKCRSDEELVSQETALADCTEFNSALGAATTQEEATHYIQIQKQQIEHYKAECRRRAEEERLKKIQEEREKQRRVERELQEAKERKEKQEQIERERKERAEQLEKEQQEREEKEAAFKSLVIMKNFFYGLLYFGLGLFVCAIIFLLLCDWFDMGGGPEFAWLIFALIMISPIFILVGIFAGMHYADQISEFEPRDFRYVNKKRKVRSLSIGKITSLEVEDGENVVKGESIIIMSVRGKEINITAPVDGKVSFIVTSGDKISFNALLAIIEYENYYE